MKRYIRFRKNVTGVDEEAGMIFSDVIIYIGNNGHVYFLDVIDYS